MQLSVVHNRILKFLGFFFICMWHREKQWMLTKSLHLLPLRLFHTTSTTMQHHVSATPVFLLCRRRPCSGPDPHDFAETLPAEMSERIFGELDTASLCSASCTCKLWHNIIEESQQLWRSQCLRVRAVCPSEVDRDRGDGFSWKVSACQ